MGDWNTLHFFDDKHFYEKVAPDLSNEGFLLKKYFESDLWKHILFDNNNSDARIKAMLDFCQDLDTDFKKHKELASILNRKKQPDEEYSRFRHHLNEDEKEFESKNSYAFGDLSDTLQLLLFSECASFNPHLILGRHIFTGAVDAKPKSVSEKIIWKITDSEIGSVFSYGGTGIINWITNEELQLLWLDKENLFAKDSESQDYFQEFLSFIAIAIKNNWGLISVTNVREDLLKRVKNPFFEIELDLKALGLKSVINY